VLLANMAYEADKALRPVLPSRSLGGLVRLARGGGAGVRSASAPAGGGDAGGGAGGGGGPGGRTVAAAFVDSVARRLRASPLHSVVVPAAAGRRSFGRRWRLGAFEEGD